MNPYIEKLREYQKDRPINSHWEDAQSIMELLCHIFVEHNPIENSVITYQLRELDELLRQFTMEDHDRFSNLVSDLCTEYIRQAFLTGFRVGFQLTTELSEP